MTDTTARALLKAARAFAEREQVSLEVATVAVVGGAVIDDIGRATNIIAVSMQESAKLVADATSELK